MRPSSKPEDGFSTERLQVARWGPLLGNAVERAWLIENISSLLTPSVLQHLPPPLQVIDASAEAQDWIAARDAESDVLTVQGQDGGPLIGLLILATVDEVGGVQTRHIGYMLAEAYWGRGYATELIGGLVDWVRIKGQPVRLIGGVDAGNTASAKVLLKNGFERDAGLSDGLTEMFSLDL